jgi:carbonic anhydrase
MQAARATGRVDVVEARLGDGSGPRGPEALAQLFAGNRRFARGDPRFDRPRSRRHRFAPPLAAVVSCMDGRVPVEAAFDQDTGAIVAIRSAGHVVDDILLGSVQLAVVSLRVEAVLVLGHTECAAVATAVAAARGGGRPAGAAGYLVDQIAPAVRDTGGEAPLLEVVRAHVRRTVAQLRSSARLPHGDPDSVAGAVYDVHTGRVNVVA